MVDGDLIEGGVCTSLLNGLKTMCTKYDTCFLTVSSSTCTVISHNGAYAVVDSHARSGSGMADGDGQSVVVYLSCLKDLHDHVCSLAESLSKKQVLFEIAGVRVVQTLSDEQRHSCISPAVRCEDCVKAVETIALGFGASLDCSIASAVNNVRGSKRSKSVGSCASKKLKIHDVMAVNSDVEFVSDVTVKKMQFDPLCKDVAKALCSQLNVEFEKPDAPVSTAVGMLGTPCTKEKIVADGNCFFRAVSQAVSGSQKNHRKVRLAVVRQLERNAREYKNILRGEYSSVAEYISTSKMRYVGSWATEVEIQAAADMLGVNIFTYFGDRWLEYSCRNSCLSNQGIYLENCNGNHYETVVCVHQPQLPSCYGFCKVSSSYSKGYNVRGQSSTVPVVTSSLGNKAFEEVVYIADNVTDQRTDCDVVDEVSEITLKFSPVCTEVAKTLCSKCNVEFERQDVQVHTEYGSLGDVCKTNKIIEDGNSFFRSVSEVICGSDKSYPKVRRAVVNYMENHSAEHIKILDKEFVSVAEYINKSGIRYVDSRATKMEIQATANAFGVDIFTYSGARWFKFSSVSSVLTNEGIYLKHENNHFEPVVCVRHVDEQICFDLCKVGNSSETQYMCTRNTKVQAQSNGNSCSSKINYCFSKHLKMKQQFQKKMKYMDNLLHRQKVKEIGRGKYQNSVLHREKVSEIGRGKYQENVLHREKVKEIHRGKYQNSVLHREKVSEIGRGKYQKNVLHREKVKEIQRGKYQNSVLHREKVSEIGRGKYQKNVLHREKVKEMIRGKYQNSVLHREKVSEIGRGKYQKNVLHREKVKEMIRGKYQNSVLHREKVREMGRGKYQKNVFAQGES